MCKSTTVTLICRNPGCTHIVLRFCNDRDLDPCFGYVEMCAEKLNGTVDNAHCHGVECIDIIRKSETKCKSCLEEDAKLVLDGARLQVTLNDDQDDGELLFRAQK